MAIGRLQSSFARVFTQRCFYLFVSLILLIVVAPWVNDTLRGRMIVHTTQVLVLVSAIAAVGRTAMPFVIALLLGIPALAFAFLGLLVRDDSTRHTAIATGFYVAFYLVAVVYLLRYVFSPEVMTGDKLFGAAPAI